MQKMNATSGGPKPRGLHKVLCFTEPDPDGNYLTEYEYRLLFHLWPNIQAAFEAADTAFAEARKDPKQMLKALRGPRS
jgi:hypothetical protein